MELNKEKYKVLPLGRRNQNPTHKLDQAVTLPRTAVLWRISLFHQDIERKVGCTVLILHLSALGTAPSRGLHLQKKGDEMKRFWRRGTGEEGHYLIPHLVNSYVHISPPKSPQVQSPTGATPLLSIMNLIDVFPFPGSPSSPLPATGGFKDAGLSKELVMFSWN